MSESQRTKVEAAVAPHLEVGERIAAVFVSQTVVKRRTVVVTDRHLYVFSSARRRPYEYDGPPEKTGIDRARLESGFAWGKVGAGPKLRVMPFGSAKRNFVELERVAVESRASHLWQGIEARDRGFGNTPM